MHSCFGFHSPFATGSDASKWTAAVVRLPYLCTKYYYSSMDECRYVSAFQTTISLPSFSLRWLNVILCWVSVAQNSCEQKTWSKPQGGKMSVVFYIIFLLLSREPKNRMQIIWWINTDSRHICIGPPFCCLFFMHFNSFAFRRSTADKWISNINRKSFE